VLLPNLNVIIVHLTHTATDIMVGAIVRITTDTIVDIVHTATDTMVRTIVRIAIDTIVATINLIAMDTRSS
jgi:hypothetical protein